jgi:hypothetical protein
MDPSATSGPEPRYFALASELFESRLLYPGLGAQDALHGAAHGAAHLLVVIAARVALLLALLGLLAIRHVYLSRSIFSATSR